MSASLRKVEDEATAALLVVFSSILTGKRCKRRSCLAGDGQPPAPPSSANTNGHCQQALCKPVLASVLFP
jgi:hypothetical protein